MPIVTKTTRTYKYFNGNTSVESWPFEDDSKPVKFTVKQERGLSNPINITFATPEEFTQFVRSLYTAYTEMVDAELL